MKKALLILFLMVICLSAESDVTPVPMQDISLAESTATSAPIFRKGKARQPRQRRFDKAPVEGNQRRNMRRQRQNGIGSLPILSTSNQPEA